MNRSAFSTISIPLSKALICPNCDMIHDGPMCPTCDKQESFPLEKWLGMRKAKREITADDIEAETEEVYGVEA